MLLNATVVADQSPYIQRILDFLFYYLTYKNKRSIDPHIALHHEKQGIINCSARVTVEPSVNTEQRFSLRGSVKIDQIHIHLFSLLMSSDPPTPPPHRDV